MNDDSYVKVLPTVVDGALRLEITAKRTVTITELQGGNEVLEAMGATMPDICHRRQFGEGVEVPPGMAADVDFMNQANFRWGCDVPIKGGETKAIEIPADKPGSVDGVITLAYRYPRLLGLLKGEGAIYVKLGDKGVGARG